MASEFNPEEIARQMTELRDRTRELLSIVIEEADLRRPPSEGFRPLLWHLGHVGAFEEYWFSQKVKGDPPRSERYSAIFDPIKTPREDANSLPPIPEIEDYLARVRTGSLDLLANVDTNRADSLTEGGYIFDLVLEHERQHQETICYLLQMLDPRLKRKPELPEALLKAPTLGAAFTPEMVHVPGGEFEMGADLSAFAYDNERPLHRTYVPAFRIDRYPVTNGEYAEFIEAGGYDARPLWDAGGWAWKQEQKIDRPLYWSREATGDGWRLREMFEERRLPADHPVTGVSWYEATAYARFAGKRLPTEAEWEKAASWDDASHSKRRFSWGDETPRPELANFDNNHWRTTPVALLPEGESAYGCLDLTGNVWEWTATVFAGYPGFEAFPYPEYSELWFDGDHRVLKGGSWTTQGALLRTSFRNFFRPHFRAAFAGFRCAADE
ncbi:MAG TPA: ergothioneine biosynthesis protein EgtB [Blastocatellia bacterium]|nr:ergothioneine biosynthesis protein EgtB [Blastocatellia bacterium]